jgi:hypothetical protein
VKITVYQKPTCTTSRQVHAALRDASDTRVMMNSRAILARPADRIKEIL